MKQHLFFESIFNDYNPIYSDILAFISIGCAILVIITKNPVVSVLYLIVTFIVVGLYLIMLNMTFLGLSYLLVYIGAIAILFLFIIMLLDIKSFELININKNSKILGIVLTILFINPIYSLIPRSFHHINKYIYNWSINEDIYMLYNINWETSQFSLSHLSIIGNLMYNYYLIWLFITAFILLLSLIGTIALIAEKK